MHSNRWLLVPLFVAVTGLTAQAQPAAPAPPKEYQVKIRYRIQAAPTERIRQFLPMLDYLESLGFHKDAGPEDEVENAAYIRMSGRISSANARKLLDEPHVKSLLLMPEGYKLPGLDEQDKPVKVQLQLVGGLPLAQQRLLAEQVRERLAEFAFREAIAYDHRGFTRLVGTIRGGEVETLLKDLRGEPSGWLVPATPIAELPPPLRGISPIRVTEIIPEPEGVPPLKEPLAPPAVAKGQEHLLKITPDVAALLAKPEDAAKPARLEVILVAAPNAGSRSWQTDLVAAVPQLIVEGRFGPIITVLMPPAAAPNLAEVPIVSTIRLPRSGAPLLIPAAEAKGRDHAALAASGLARLHSLGHQGQGVRVGVIAGDFRGWEELVKNKQLPPGTRVLDLTRQRTANIEPEPYPDDGQALGHGTVCARAAAVAAPNADLLLIRVDPTTPYQLLAIARHINGEPVQSELMDQRHEELEAGNEDLQIRWRELRMERENILNDFGADEESVKKREAHFKKAKDLQAEETGYHQRIARFLQHQRDLRDLQRLQVVVNALSWPEGYPIDGSSPLTLYLNNRPFRSTTWFQPAGETRGQAWTGLFRDTDDNGIMEFAPPETPLPRGRWTSELNFLAWQPWTGKPTAELPEKTHVRLTIQWREAHDPSFLRNGEDLYREPLALLRLMLLRQRDPGATKLAADDMELVAYSYGLPQRIDNRPDAATYEITVEYLVDASAPYALRVEGRAPTDIRPASVPSVPGAKKQFDLRLRILAEVLDPAARSAGRVIFLDYPTDEGSLGMPSDAQAVFAVGAADLASQPRLPSAWGPPMNLELLYKPNFLSFDGLEVGAGDAKNVRGTSVAASFAAGLTATALGARVPPHVFLTPPFPRAGSLLRIPDNWPVGPPARMPAAR